MDTRLPTANRGRTRLITTAIAAILAITAVGAYAQGGAEAPATGDDVVMGEMPTVIDLLTATQVSTIINGILLVMSVIAAIIFFFLYVSLTRGAFAPSSFVDDVTKLVINKQFDPAIHLCQQNRDVFCSSILQRVIENRDKDSAVLMEILSTEGRRRAETIWNRIGYLSEISNIAPMLGLLGTSIGMIYVFFTLSWNTTGEKINAMSTGIATAMGTTVLGLIVAIVAGVFYTIARSRATGVLVSTEQVCHTIADHTHRAAEDPRLKKVDALADAARKKLFTGKPEVRKRPSE